MCSTSTRILLTRLLVTLGVITCASSQGGRNQPSTSQTLYSGQSQVVELYTANITQTVSRSSKAWAVQFYAAPCGHCRRFVPKYLALADDVKGWERMVTLGALACSHPDNLAACREHSIAIYPTIKYFPPSSAEDFRGLDYDCPETVTGLRMCLIDFLEGTVHKPLWWPRLEAFRTLDDLHDYINEKKYDNKSVAIVMEEMAAFGESQNYIGREVILDMVNYPSVFVARMLKDRAQNYGVQTYPSLYRFNPDRSITKMADAGGRKGFVNSIRLNILHIAAVTEEERENVLVVPVHGEPILPDGAHMQDLESALYYSFWIEVAVKQVIDGESLQALKTYVSTLATLLPVDEHVRMWLSNLRAWLLQKDSVTGEEWARSLSAVQTEAAYIPERVIWVGCLGTEPQYRGYPCSMWTTFHTLLTAAYNHTPEEGNDYNGLNVLITIREYMRHFFGCGECRDHFLEETEDIQTQVETNAEAVVWLWRMHNRVNKRLHGDSTEDPRHPKMQFPTYERCPKCHADQPSTIFERTTWVLPEITEFLNNYYGEDNIIRDSAPFKFKTGRVYYTTDSASARLHDVSCVLIVSLFVAILWL